MIKDIRLAIELTISHTWCWDKFFYLKKNYHFNILIIDSSYLYSDIYGVDLLYFSTWYLLKTSFTVHHTYLLCSDIYNVVHLTIPGYYKSKKMINKNKLRDCIALT